MVVSTAARWPKSAEIACSNRASFSSIATRSRRSRSILMSQDGNGSVRDAASWAWKASSSADKAGLFRDWSMAFPLWLSFASLGACPAEALAKAEGEVGSHRRCDPGEGALHESRPDFGTGSPFAAILARAKAFRPISAHLPVTKTKKAPPTPFPKRTGIGTYAPRPRPQRLAGCLLRKPFGTEDRRGGQPRPFAGLPGFLF